MSKTYNLHLRGYVGGSDFDASYVSYVLSKNGGKPVDVLIDSLGGSLATALSVASAFRDHGDVHAHFVGMNASAATIASLGAKHISIDSSAMYLVHKCSMSFFQWASMNADQLQSEIEQMEQTRTDLEKMDGNVAGMYAQKCKRPVEDLLALMKVGGWLTAQEALDWGFVDEITNQREDAAPVLTDKVATAMAAVGMPVPNLPVQEGSIWEKLLTALNSLVSQSSAKADASSANQPLNNKPTMKVFPFLASLLALDALAFECGKCSLTEAQVEAIEAHLKQQKEAFEAAEKAAKDALAAADAKLAEAKAASEAEATRVATEHAEAIAAKETRIAELQALLDHKPAADSQQVLNNGNNAAPENPVDAFYQTLASARKLFNAVP